MHVQTLVLMSSTVTKTLILTPRFRHHLRVAQLQHQTSKPRVLTNTKISCFFKKSKKNIYGWTHSTCLLCLRKISFTIIINNIV